jgi:hypothetical protein
MLGSCTENVLGLAPKPLLGKDVVAMVRYPIATIKAISLYETVDHGVDTLRAMNRNGLCSLNWRPIAGAAIHLSHQYGLSESA